MYAWANSRNFSDLTLARMVGNGFNTAGIFSNLARRLVALDSSQIHYLGDENLADEKVRRYAFHLSGGAGGWQISSRSQNGTETGEAAEDGVFWIDSKGSTLRKIDVRATAIPRKLRLKSLRIVVDYEAVSIGDRRVLLPSEALVKSGLKSDLDRESHIAFNHCHAFRSESKVSFVDAQDSEEASMRVKEELPAGLHVPIQLLSPISLAEVDSNDLLKAVVSRSVRYHQPRDHPQRSRRRRPRISPPGRREFRNRNRRDRDAVWPVAILRSTYPEHRVQPQYSSAGRSCSKSCSWT